MHVCWCRLYNWGLSYCTIYLSDPCISTPVFKLKLDKILSNKLPTFCIHWKAKTPFITMRYSTFPNPNILIIKKVLLQRPIHLHAVKEQLTWDYSRPDAGVDTRTLLYAMFSKMERNKISQRVCTGVAYARYRNPMGVWGNTTVEILQWRYLVGEMYKSGVTAKNIALRTGTEPKTVYNDLYKF